MSSGFRPVQDLSGNGYTGKVQTFAVNAAHTTLLAVGDLVVETGNLEVSTGLSEVDALQGAGPITGVIVAVDPNFSALETKGVPALTANTVKVAVDPALLLEVDTEGGTFAVTDVGGNLPAIVTPATMSAGLVNSNMRVNTTLASTVASNQLRVVSVPRATAEVTTFPAPAGTTIVVRINESTINRTAGV